jgi:dephospho-CoA kinase
MMRVGLTGGIGSGKTTVGRIFRTMGIPVFEADAEGRRLMAHDAALQRSIVERFGARVVNENGIDRATLAGIVFQDTEALKELNALIHPAVRAAFDRWAREQRAPYVMMEAAVLAESGGHRTLDAIVVVSAPEPIRIRRVMQRDEVPEEAVRARLANQVSEAERLAIADHVIHNDDSRLVIPQVLEVHAALLKFAGA